MQNPRQRMLGSTPRMRITSRPVSSRATAKRVVGQVMRDPGSPSSGEMLGRLTWKS